MKALWLKSSTAIIALAVFFFSSVTAARAGSLTKEQLVASAVGAFQKLGGRLSERIIIYDVNNWKWEKKFESLSKDGLADKFSCLEGMNYQAVCFKIKPKPNLRGHDIWVFVERNTGTILALYTD